MNTTGIVRRIDELGRVVIPKEIRKTMRIKEGEELEVCVSGEDTLVLRKYSPVKSMEKLGADYVEILSRNTSCACFLCDTDEITASYGDKSFPVGAKISKATVEFISKRKSAFFRKNESLALLPGSEKTDTIIAPIITGGDAVGALVLISKTSLPSADKCLKLLEVGASFFAKQLE